jgi:RND superfamily putative drug exporter
MEQRVSQMPDIAGIRGAPPPTPKSTEEKSGDGTIGGGSRGGGADAFPNTAALMYSVADTGNAAPDLGLPAGPAAPADDTAMFVSIVRGLGFAMSVDVAEIANTVNAAPVTVLDVVATTTHDGGALKKISDFAEQLETLPESDTIESASRNVRQILDNASNDLRALGNDGPGKEDRTAAPQQDAHSFADAIRQMIDGLKALISQTAHTSGGLTHALTAFISPDGHTARYLVETKLNPFGTEAMNQIRRIVDTARGPHPDAMLRDASISASGITAMLRDTRAYYDQDIGLIIAMTILIVFLILVAILRAVVAPLYLIASVVISYLSALGVGVVFFQFILKQDLTWSIPGLTFIVLVAMGADYNLLLISRLRDESAHGVRDGVIRTVSSTGGVITAAGVIFAASMFGMLFASISTLVQAGFIVGTGLLLDTFLVRTITVPAMAVLVGNANWWPSRPPQVPTPGSGSTSEAPDGAVDHPGTSRNETQTDVVDGTDSDVVALRS